MKKITAIIVALALVVFMASLLPAQDKKADEHQYIGAKKCKLCHSRDKVYPTWAETPHAKAWDVLDSAAQKNEKCVGCHSTGTTADGELLTGVQCEACHGPGSDYKTMSIMKDKEKAIAHGLILPDSTTCQKCHNENVPKEFQPKEGYNFAEMMKTGLHAMPAGEAEKK